MEKHLPIESDSHAFGRTQSQLSAHRLRQNLTCMTTDHDDRNDAAMTSNADDRGTVSGEFAVMEAFGPGLRQQLLLEHGERPIAALGRLETRATKAIDRAGITTIGQLIDTLDGAPALAKASFGRVTYDNLIEQLDEVARVGLTRFVFGMNAEPSTAKELFEAYLCRLENPRHREIFRLRYAEDRTLQEIADLGATPVTRERIRQILELNAELDRPVWGDAASRILGPLEELLESGGGIAPLAHCLLLAGATTQGQLEFTADLASRPPGLIVTGAAGVRVVSRLTPEATSTLRTELRRALDEALAHHSSLAQAQSVLREFGVRLPAELELELLRDYLLVDVNGSAAYASRRKTQAIWVEALRLAGGVVSAKTVAEAVAKSHPDEPASPRNAAAHFCRSSEVFNVGKDKWAHVEHLGLERSALAQLADACLAVMPRRHTASSVKHLLRKVAETMTVPSGLSPYVVRDAMTHTGKVRGWRNSLDVAWLDLDGSRASIADRIRLSAPQLTQPFHISELTAEVAALGGTTEESVMVQVQSAVDLLALGGGEYMVREVLFPDEASFVTEQARVVTLVPEHRVVTSRELAELAKVGAPRPGMYDDPRIAWAVAHRHAGLATRVQRALLWRADHASAAWDAFERESTFTLGATFKAAEFRAWLSDVHGIDDDVFPYALLQEGVESGALVREGRNYSRVSPRGGVRRTAASNSESARPF